MSPSLLTLGVDYAYSFHHALPSSTLTDVACSQRRDSIVAIVNVVWELGLHVLLSGLARVIAVRSLGPYLCTHHVPHLHIAFVVCIQYRCRSHLDPLPQYLSKLCVRLAPCIRRFRPLVRPPGPRGICRCPLPHHLRSPLQAPCPCVHAFAPIRRANSPVRLHQSFPGEPVIQIR